MLQAAMEGGMSEREGPWCLECWTPLRIEEPRDRWACGGRCKRSGEVHTVNGREVRVVVPKQKASE